LRERVEDIPMLVERLLVTFGRGDIDVSEAALDRLRAHDWPGNVRELKNALGYAIAVLDPHVSRLEPEHLPHPLSRAEHGRDAGVDALPLSGRTLSSLECAAIGQTLRHAKGNRARAAETLGIPVSKLEEKLREYGLVGV
jgi:DNA-binding NtrC family response regulator